MEAEPVSDIKPLNDNYAAYVGAMRLTSAASGFEYPIMTEVEFEMACENAGYVHTSIINMDVFEASVAKS